MALSFGIYHWVLIGLLGFFCDILLYAFLFVFFLEDTLKALKEKAKEPQAPEPEPEPTTEVLFLCSYEGCGKTFIDAGALRKHSHIHGERQYVCHYEGCGKVIRLTFHVVPCRI